MEPNPHESSPHSESETITDIAEDIHKTHEYASSGYGIKPKNERFRLILRYVVLAAMFALVAIITPFVLPNHPVWSILPALFLLLYIFFTKRVFESLTLAIVLGFLMAVSVDGFEGLGFFDAVNVVLIQNVASEDTAWLFVVCGLMGSFVALIERAGGVHAFGVWVSKRAKTRKSTLLWTWLLGLIIFVDDYLNSLTVGSCMAPLTDKHKVSREYLAFVVDSTAAPDTTLIPVSTWAVFIAALYDATLNDHALPNTYGDGLRVFIASIPFNFYAWFCLLLVPLTILGIVPLVGKMKRAEHRAQTTGVLAPPGSEKIDIRAGEAVTEHKGAKVRNFFVPILVLIASTIYFDLDLQYGVIFTLGFLFLFYLVQGLINAEEFFTLAIKGFKNMLTPLIMVVLAYMFADAIKALGFMDFIVGIVSTNVPVWLIPAVIFLVFGFTEFIMGLSWGMYAIAIPLVTLISYQMGIHPALAIAAVVSAGVWGSHVCFYSDATILSSSAAGCDNFEHATSQLPYGLMAALAALLAFVGAGILFT